MNNDQLTGDEEVTDDQGRVWSPDAEQILWYRDPAGNNWRRDGHCYGPNNRYRGQFPLPAGPIYAAPISTASYTTISDTPNTAASYTSSYLSYPSYTSQPSSDQQTETTSTRSDSAIHGTMQGQDAAAQPAKEWEEPTREKVRAYAVEHLGASEKTYLDNIKVEHLQKWLQAEGRKWGKHDWLPIRRRAQSGRLGGIIGFQRNLTGFTSRRGTKGPTRGPFNDFLEAHKEWCPGKPYPYFNDTIVRQFQNNKPPPAKPKNYRADQRLSQSDLVEFARHFFGANHAMNFVFTRRGKGAHAIELTVEATAAGFRMLGKNDRTSAAEEVLSVGSDDQGVGHNDQPAASASDVNPATYWGGYGSDSSAMTSLTEATASMSFMAPDYSGQQSIYGSQNIGVNVPQEPMEYSTIMSYGQNRFNQFADTTYNPAPPSNVTNTGQPYQNWDTTAANDNSLSASGGQHELRSTRNAESPKPQPRRHHNSGRSQYRGERSS